MHGVKRGGHNGDDDVPGGQPPVLDACADDEGLLVFVQSVTCRRKLWAEIFECAQTPGEYMSSLLVCSAVLTRSSVSTVPCCDICCPTLLERTRPSPVVKPVAPVKAVAKGVPNEEMRSLLEDWRQDVFDRDHRRSPLDSTAILNDEDIAHLSSIGELTLEILEGILQPSWLWWDRYGQDLVELTKGIKTPYIPLPKAPRKTKRASEEDTDKDGQSVKKPRTRAEPSTQTIAPSPVIASTPRTLPSQTIVAGPSNPGYASLPLAAHPIYEHHLPPRPVHQQSSRGPDEHTSREQFQPAPMLPQPAVRNIDSYPIWYRGPIMHSSSRPLVNGHGVGTPLWQDFRGQVYTYPPYIHPDWTNAQALSAPTPPAQFSYTSQHIHPVYAHPNAQQHPLHRVPDPDHTQ